MATLDPIAALFQPFTIPLKPLGFSSAISVLALLTLNWVVMNEEQDMVASRADIKTHFDFIVVGAGSAGAVVAHRLSEDGRYSVLLLEAGGIPPPFISYPLVSPFNIHLDTDWKYRTVPQNNSCFGLKKQRMKWPRGKLLGGTSNLNWMLYVRGHPMDFNRWAEISQDDQWNYENLLPYFRKMEDYKGNFHKHNKFHGTDGPTCISKHDEAPLVETWLQAGKELGYTTGTDYNAYQQPAQIKLDNVTKRAIGVTYERHEKVNTVFAKKEIILSAGAIGTPQILLLSGIGPRAHLKSMGIKQKVKSPGVGRNLQDHVSIFFGPFVLNDTVSLMLKRNITVEAAIQYRNNKTGLVAYNFVSGGALFSSSQATRLSGKTSWPDSVIILGTPSFSDEDDADSVAHFLGVEKKVFSEYVKPFYGKDAVWVLITVGLPKSHGTIELASKDPFTHPNIDPKYFDKAEDMKVMVEAMKFSVRVFEETKAWQKYDAKFSPGHKLPGCEMHPEKSSEYFECYGKPGDRLAVLNSNLSVKGVEGLRVADASVMPIITNANINAPCIMIGEKVSQLILDQWADHNGGEESSESDEKSATGGKDLLQTIAIELGKFKPIEAIDSLVKSLFK
ncbi:unnamed protein product [Orchesella dallaii]|uniref:Glucose-methanol-choline oxidoreductase N-terminal domain-containing protein n=1 Tax=Orchesella dallaii TaxID=48710 RepID=A0ABP1RMM5_9HEXA